MNTYKILLNKYIAGIDKDKYTWHLECDFLLKQYDIIFLQPDDTFQDKFKPMPLEILKVCPEFSYGKFCGYLCLVARADDIIKDKGYKELIK